MGYTSCCRHVDIQCSRLTGWCLSVPSFLTLGWLWLISSAATWPVYIYTFYSEGWYILQKHLSGSVAEWLACWTQAQWAWVQIAAVALSCNSLRQTVHTHCASVRQAAKLVAALLRVARVTTGLAEHNGSLPPSLWLTSPAGWLPRTGISSGTLRSVIEYGLPIHFYLREYIWSLKISRECEETSWECCVGT